MKFRSGCQRKKLAVDQRRCNGKRGDTVCTPINSTYCIILLYSLEKNICQRLLPLDHQYTEKQAENLCKSEQLLLALWQSSQRRLFLLKLKGKYAGLCILALCFKNLINCYYIDGQKIAKKLSLQISKESSKIQSLLKEYNSCELPSPHANSLSTSDVFNPSILEDQLKQLGTWCSVASGEKREIIDSYLILCRSQEEISMLQEDADNCVTYYKNREDVILQEINKHSLETLFDKGAVALLHSLLAENSLLLNESVHAVEVMRNYLGESDSVSIPSYSETSSSEDEV